MNDKTRRALYVVAGGYLVYLGIQLLANRSSGEMNVTISTIGGILFCLFGVGLIVDFVRHLIRERKENEKDDMEKADKEEEENGCE